MTILRKFILSVGCACFSAAAVRAEILVVQWVLRTGVENLDPAGAGQNVDRMVTVELPLDLTCTATFAGSTATTTFLFTVEGNFAVFDIHADHRCVLPTTEEPWAASFGEIILRTGDDTDLFLTANARYEYDFSGDFMSSVVNLVALDRSNFRTSFSLVNDSQIEDTVLRPPRRGVISLQGEAFVPRATTCRLFYQCDLYADPWPRPVRPATGVGDFLYQFSPAPVPAPGDVTCDGLVDQEDLAGFVLLLTDRRQYRTQHLTCNYFAADMNGDGQINGGDISLFVSAVLGG